MFPGARVEAGRLDERRCSDAPPSLHFPSHLVFTQTIILHFLWRHEEGNPHLTRCRPHCVFVPRVKESFDLCRGFVFMEGLLCLDCNVVRDGVIASSEVSGLSSSSDFIHFFFFFNEGFFQRKR